MNVEIHYFIGYMFFSVMIVFFCLGPPCRIMLGFTRIIESFYQIYTSPYWPNKHV